MSRFSVLKKLQHEVLNNHVHHLNKPQIILSVVFDLLFYTLSGERKNSTKPQLLFATWL